MMVRTNKTLGALSGGPLSPLSSEKLARLRRIVASVRGRSRGVTLIEILIVLAIVGLIAGGIAVFAIPKFKDAQIATTKQSAQQLHTISESWHATHTQELSLIHISEPTRPY